MHDKHFISIRTKGENKHNQTTARKLYHFGALFKHFISFLSHLIHVTMKSYNVAQKICHNLLTWKCPK